MQKLGNAPGAFALSQTVPRGNPLLSIRDRAGYRQPKWEPYGPKTTFNTPSALTKGCVICGQKENIALCGDCESVEYCGTEHKASHKSAHQKTCMEIAHLRSQLEIQSSILIAEEGKGVFTDPPGVFWGNMDGQLYLDARWKLAEVLMKLDTCVAITAALDHLLGMLRLNRPDYQSLRELIPALYLRLGREQECYDFLKWWNTTGSRDDYDFFDLDIDFLNVKDANVFEAVQPFAANWRNLSHMIALTLLKVRLLNNLQILKQQWQEAQRLNPAAQKGDDKILENDPTPQVELLEAQIKKLFKGVHAANKKFWPLLLNPREHLLKYPHTYKYGDLREAQLLLHFNYNSWFETPGAIDVVKKLSR